MSMKRRVITPRKHRLEIRGDTQKLFHDGQIALHQEDFAAQMALQGRLALALALGYDPVVARLVRWSVRGHAALACRMGRHTEVAALRIAAEVRLKPGNGGCGSLGSAAGGSPPAEEDFSVDKKTPQSLTEASVWQIRNPLATL
jgi:hypothetical protein